MLKRLAAECAWGLYALVGRAATPLIRRHLRRRAAQGREDALRLSERLGHADRPRPEGPLIWVHGASVGEALSALPLLERLAAERPFVTLLVTTGTQSSAKVLAQRLPENAIHQFAPIDLPAAVRRFLGHWRPDLGLIIESELWPNLITQASRAGVRLVLLNGRISLASFQSWRRARPLIERLLARFSLTLAQSPEHQARFAALGARHALCLGNLKFAAPPLAADRRQLTALRDALGPRRRWLAASTHEGEEIVAAEVHRKLASAFPGLVTLIVPRHPERGPEIEQALAQRGHKVWRRSLGQGFPGGSGIYLADTIGELGLWYGLCEIVFVGGSLVAKGGQNPLEPARLDSAILYGPHRANFAPILAEMEACGAVQAVANGQQLAEAVGALLRDGAKRRAMSRAAESYGKSQSQVLDATLAALEPYLDQLSPPRRAS
ncbi:MAG: 3-deoxy-D-manno-octulosonic acid transferase [Rhodospirillales bacterium]|nr:3-deoxy-D-manno-octulosonic acid transferase [Rhodospirillales bacterium]